MVVGIREAHKHGHTCTCRQPGTCSCVQVELAKRLVGSSFADKVFFCNTGAEANEGAIKFARKWARVKVGAY